MSDPAIERMRRLAESFSEGATPSTDGKTEDDPMLSVDTGEIQKARGIDYENEMAAKAYLLANAWALRVSRPFVHAVKGPLKVSALSYTDALGDALRAEREPTTKGRA